MARPKKVTPVIAGSRVGTKRSDTRWQAPDGTVWASRFEFAVYIRLKEAGYDVRKTDEQDRMAYASGVTNGRCTECGSDSVVTERHYTPDLFVVPKHGSGGQVDPHTGRTGYYLEIKGPVRPERRSLLRAFCAFRPDCDLRVVVQRDHRVTAKRSLVQWVSKYMNCPATEWDGDPAATLHRLDMQRQKKVEESSEPPRKGTRKSKLQKMIQDSATASTKAIPNPEG